MSDEKISLEQLTHVSPGTPVSFHFNSRLRGMIGVRGFVERIKPKKIYVGSEIEGFEGGDVLVHKTRPYSLDRISENSIMFEGIGSYKSQRQHDKGK